MKYYFLKLIVGLPDWYILSATEADFLTGYEVNVNLDFRG